MFDLDRWEADLASGEFTPVTGYLNAGDNHMCCLGVLVNQADAWEVAEGIQGCAYKGRYSFLPLDVEDWLNRQLDVSKMECPAKWVGISAVNLLMQVNDKTANIEKDYASVRALIAAGRKRVEGE